MLDHQIDKFIRKVAQKAYNSTIVAFALQGNIYKDMQDLPLAAISLRMVLHYKSSMSGRYRLQNSSSLREVFIPITNSSRKQ